MLALSFRRAFFHKKLLAWSVMLRARLVVVVVALLALAFLSGCHVHLPGLDDVEVEYDAKPPAPAAGAPKAPVGAGVALQVELRLLRARVPATVAPVGSTGVRVTVDKKLEGALGHALAWHGGLTIFRLDPSHRLDVELAERASSDDVLRAAEEVTDDTHRLLYDAQSGPTPVLRVAHKKPLHDFGSAKAEAEGKRLVLPIKAPASLEALSKELGDEVVAFTRGPYILHQGRLRDCLDLDHGGHAALVIPRGTDIYAYSRARRDARVLAPPPLMVEVHEVSRRALPVNARLAAGCVLFPLVTGFLWLLFVRRLDRARPEPWWLMLATCVLGGFSGELAGFIEHQLRLATPYLDPDVMTLDSSALAFPISLLVYSISVGAVEEGCKLLATWALATHRREFDEPVDGMLYAAAAAIGFAVDENISYFAGYRLGGGLVASRSLDCIAGHTLLAAIWGYALGKRLVRKHDSKRRTRVLPYFVLAAFLHGAMDTMITYQIPYSPFLVIIVLTTLFIVLLRKALRWGSTDEVRGDAPLSTHRLLFRTGGGPPLGAAVFSMYLMGTLLLFVGRVIDADQRRVSLSLLILTASFLGLLSLSAYAVARTLPLDVAIDELGVTFAGALRRWSTIEGTTRIRRGRLWLHSSDGDLDVGPATERTIEQIEETIRERTVKSVASPSSRQPSGDDAS